jgi:hypothetical protein
VNDPAVLRDIHRERGATVLVAILAVVVPGLVLTVLAWSVHSGPHEREDVGSLVSLAFAYVVFDLGPLAYLLQRPLRGTPEVRLDAQGIVWGDDRRRHLSLDWNDIARVRIWPNPIQLGDTGSLVFDPVPGHGVTHRGGPVQQLRDRIFRSEYGTKFVVSTWSTDCSFTELCHLVEARVPRTALPADSAS